MKGEGKIEREGEMEGEGETERDINEEEKEVAREDRATYTISV